MPGSVAQWTIDQFFSALQSVWELASRAQVDLDANRSRLMQLWNVTKTETPQLEAQHQAILSPLIHQNSVLRVSYLAPLMAKYREAVNAGAGALRQAGYTAPGLGWEAERDGLGVLPAVILVPAVAITAIVLALSAASIITNLTAAQRKNTDAAAAIIGNPALTPAERAAELKALSDATRAAAEAANKSNPFGLSLGAMVPILALVAVILLGPSIVKMLPGRKAA